MSCKSLLALSLVGAVVLFLTGSASANPEPNRHTMTIFNGAHVVQQNFVEKNGSWRNCGELKNYDVFFRDCPRSPWHFYGTYNSPRCAEEVACSLRAKGNLASVRHQGG